MHTGGSLLYCQLVTWAAAGRFRLEMCRHETHSPAEERPASLGGGMGGSGLGQAPYGGFGGPSPRGWGGSGSGTASGDSVSRTQAPPSPPASPPVRPSRTDDGHRPGDEPHPTDHREGLDATKLSADGGSMENRARTFHQMPLATVPCARREARLNPILCVCDGRCGVRWH